MIQEVSKRNDGSKPAASRAGAEGFQKGMLGTGRAVRGASAGDGRLDGWFDAMLAVRYNKTCDGAKGVSRATTRACGVGKHLKCAATKAEAGLKGAEIGTDVDDVSYAACSVGAGPFFTGKDGASKPT